MAARKSGKVSRRQAVVALGAGLVGGSIGLSATQTPTPPPKSGAQSGASKFPKCDKKETTAVFQRKAVGTNPPRQLQLASCCEYLRQVLDAGYKTNLDPEIKGKLKQFITYLQEQHSQNLLLDYCFVQFDVKEEQLPALRNAVANALAG
jgi:hypothetical protein